MENEGLVYMKRDGAEAYVHPEWVEEWQAMGWKKAKAPQPKPDAPAED